MATKQTAFFFANASAWFSGGFERDPGEQCVHLIRADDDPERKPRPVGGQKDRTPHLTLKKTSVEHWRDTIYRHLIDDVPRTFNRIGVELLDKTADILWGTPVDDALWSLVGDGLVEHTGEAPILFRICKGGV